MSCIVNVGARGGGGSATSVLLLCVWQTLDNIVLQYSVPIAGDTNSCGEFVIKCRA